LSNKIKLKKKIIIKHFEVIPSNLKPYLQRFEPTKLKMNIILTLIKKNDIFFSKVGLSSKLCLEP
jgi:hypothetical protein